MPQDESDSYSDTVGHIEDPIPEEDQDADIDLDSLDSLSEDEVPTRLKEDYELGTEFWKTRKNQYLGAAKELRVDPDLIYEPANETDITTTRAFPDSEVVFADINERAVEAVNEAFEENESVNSVCEDAEQYELARNPDLVIFRNAIMDETKALENNPAPYVFTNSLETAEMDQYELVGIVPQNGSYLEDASSIDESESPDDMYVFERTD